MAADLVWVGDGEFPGEGGHCLQVLWEAFPWSKMRVHCPGRYYIPRGIASRDSPRVLIDNLQWSESIKLLLVSRLTEISKDGKDPMLLIFFPGGGGLLTYTKQNPPTYIHTLNTSSGMERKLKAMNLSEYWDTRPKDD